MTSYNELIPKFHCGGPVPHDSIIAIASPCISPRMTKISKQGDIIKININIKNPMIETAEKIKKIFERLKKNQIVKDIERLRKRTL